MTLLGTASGPRVPAGMAGISGDTSPSDNLVAFYKRVDVSIQEVIDLDVLRRLVPNQQRVDAIVAVTPRRSDAWRVKSMAKLLNANGI